MQVHEKEGRRDEACAHLTAQLDELAEGGGVRIAHGEGGHEGRQRHLAALERELVRVRRRILEPLLGVRQHCGEAAQSLRAVVLVGGVEKVDLRRGARR
jgi:hypothetical protein